MERVRQIAKALIGLSGYYRLRYRASTRAEKRLLVLMYHAIDDDDAPCGLRQSVTRSQFAVQMGVLRRTCRVLPLHEAVDALFGDLPLAQNAVAVTFDDGYASVHDRAFPILERNAMPATVFLATGWIDGRFDPWWERLARAFEAWSVGDGGLDEIVQAAGLRPDSRTGDDLAVRRRLLFEVEGRVRPLAEERAQALVELVVTILRRHAARTPAATPTPLTWPRISDMAKRGVSFGAHTRSHVNLAAADPRTAREEIEGSKRDIEARLGCGVRGFAYPYGQLGDPTRWEPVLRELGFGYACTTVEGTNGRRSDRYLLRRACLPRVSAPWLQRRALYLNFLGPADGPLASTAA